MAKLKAWWQQIVAAGWKPVRKLVAAGLSGLTTTGVMAWLGAAGVRVDQAVASLIVLAATIVAGYLMPEAKTE